MSTDGKYISYSRDHAFAWELDSSTALAPGIAEEPDAGIQDPVVASVPAAFPDWNPSEMTGLALALVEDAGKHRLVWTRVFGRADVQRLLWMQDQLASRACPERDMLGWLTLAHVAPRRRPIIMRTRTILAEGVDFDSLASRRCVRKV